MLTRSRFTGGCCFLCSLLVILATSSRYTSFRRAKPSLEEHWRDHCFHLQDTYEQLLQPLFSHWNESGFGLDLLEHTSGERVYILDGKVFLSESTW